MRCASLKLFPFILRFFPLLLLFSFFQSNGQGTVLPLGQEAYHILDRLEIKSGVLPNYHSSLKPYTRGDAMRYALGEGSSYISEKKDDQDFYFLCCENNDWLCPDAPHQTVAGKKSGYYEKIPGDTLYRFIPASKVETSQESEYYFKSGKPIWGLFYSTPANWFQLDKQGFHVRLNPIVNFKVGKSGNDEPGYFYNQRGFELRGGVDDRVYFYSNILDTQARFPEYVRNYIDKNKAIPGNGLYKPYESSVIDNLNGYDYLNGQAHIGLNVTKSIGLQFGHGKNFIGNGYRSMLLSDFSHNYLYLKANWKLWRFHYQNLFAELSANSAEANPGEINLPKKYMAAHYLSFNLTEKMTFGIYEMVMFQRENGFELNYLNPVILYRSVEHLLDSEDNIIIGLDYKWNIKNNAQLYAQFIIDEYKFSELTSGDGWWANKYGAQIGAKYIDLFGIDHLDIQAEYNMARPYTFTHRDTLGANYTHYNQALGHPLGANFREVLFIAKYKPTKRLLLDGRFIYADYGEDTETEIWGGNPLMPVRNRVRDYGNRIGQGISTNTYILGLDISYQLWHNIFLDLHFFYRKKESELPGRSNTDSFFGGGFRMNMSKARNDF